VITDAKMKLQTSDRRRMRVMRELAREGKNLQDLFCKTTKENDDSALDQFCSSYV
jgi:hypothetical protein